ncbi:MAG: hypothetical protein ACREIC_33865, partial [Limisphaerales bacterium]
ACGLWLFLMLRQSLTEFRQAAVRKGILLSRAVLLGALIFLYAFLAGDFVTAARNASARPQAELEQALVELPSKQRAGNVGLSQLEATGALSASTEAWLRGARISYQPVGVLESLNSNRVNIGPPNETETMKAFRKRYGLLGYYSVNVHFPDGTDYGFSFH